MSLTEEEKKQIKKYFKKKMEEPMFQDSSNKTTVLGERKQRPIPQIF